MGSTQMIYGSALNIQLSKKAGEFLQKIPQKHAGQIATKIQEIVKNPASRPPHSLKGFPLYYRVKSGEYRFIYKIQGDTLLLILLIGKRNDDEIYRDFLQLIG